MKDKFIFFALGMAVSSIIMSAFLIPGPDRYSDKKLRAYAECLMKKENFECAPILDLSNRAAARLYPDF